MIRRLLLIFLAISGKYYAMIPSFLIHSVVHCHVVAVFRHTRSPGHRKRFGKIGKLISRRGVSRGFWTEMRQTWATAENPLRVMQGDKFARFWIDNARAARWRSHQFRVITSHARSRPRKVVTSAADSRLTYVISTV